MNLPTFPRFFRQPLPGFQRGAVSIAIIMLLLFILAAAVTAILKLSGSSAIDAAKNEDQTDAMFLAESGLERARSILQTNPSTQCSTTALPSTPISLGRGTFSYAAPTYTVTACPGTTSTSCCSVMVTGNVGSSSRTLRLDVAIGGGGGGVAGTGGKNNSDKCTDSPIATSVTNPSNVPAVVLSVLGYNQHVEGGAPLSSRNCTPPVQTVILNSQNFESQGEKSLVGVRGNIYDVATSGTIPKILQGLTNNSDYSLVSVIFPQLPGASLLKLDTYWNDIKHRANNTGTEQEEGVTGSTNSGVANHTDVCDTPLSLGIAGTFPNSYHGAEQSCHSWCYGGDTLIFSLVHGGRSSTSNVPQGSVKFNTAGSPAQNISMIRQVHLNSPNNGNNDDDRSQNIYSEIWYAYNPNYLSAGDIASGAVVNGHAGASFNGSIPKNSTTLTVSTAPTYPLQVGDMISGGNVDAGTKICAFGTGTTGGTGDYTVSTNCTTRPGQSAKTNDTALTSQSVSLTTTTTPTPTNVTVGDKLFNGATLLGKVTGITGTGAPGTILTLDSPAFVTASATIRSDQTNVYTATSVSKPTEQTMIVAVFSGTGQLAAGTTVLSGATANSFQLSLRPNIPLTAATICGGTCAFFNNPSSTSSTTSFTVKTENDNEDENTNWVGGFSCLSGVDSSKITATIGSSTSTAANWHEVVK